MTISAFLFLVMGGSWSALFIAVATPASFAAMAFLLIAALCHLPQLTALAGCHWNAADVEPMSRPSTRALIVLLFLVHQAAWGLIAAGSGVISVGLNIDSVAFWVGFSARFALQAIAPLVLVLQVLEGVQRAHSDVSMGVVYAQLVVFVAYIIQAAIALGVSREDEPPVYLIYLIAGSVAALVTTITFIVFNRLGARADKMGQQQQLIQK